MMTAILPSSASRRPCTAALALVFLGAVAARAADTPAPRTVTIPGSFQSELGCPGDWQPDCAATHLTDATGGVWRATFNVPAGDWEYKAALNDSWDENYGLNATRNGPNIPLSLGQATEVKFYYSHDTHWVTDNRRSVIATAPGSYQHLLGCTHYAFVRDPVAQVMGAGVELVDSAPAIARRTQSLLRDDGKPREATTGSFRVLTTGEPRTVAPVISRLWGAEVPVESVEI